MNRDRKATQFTIALIAAALSGCASASARLYTLDSSATSDGSPPLQTAVLVEPVSVPAAVDQPQFVIRVAPNKVAVEEFDRWDGPLTESIARVVAGDLSALLEASNVAIAPMADFNPAYTVTITIQRFESIRNEGALVVRFGWCAMRPEKPVPGEPQHGKPCKAKASMRWRPRIAAR